MPNPPDPNDPFAKLFQQAPAQPAAPQSTPMFPPMSPSGVTRRPKPQGLDDEDSNSDLNKGGYSADELRRVADELDDEFGDDPPAAPSSWQDTGLSEYFLQELILKCISIEGAPRGVDIAHHLRLPYSCISGILDSLKQRQQVAVTGGGRQFGTQTMQYSLTEKGSSRVEDVMKRDNYCGPAPVPAQQFFDRMMVQSITNSHVSPQRVAEEFGSLVLDPTIPTRMGPAINSGRSMFLYGPPGNGKTSLAECITKTVGGVIHVPHAIIAEQQIVKIFDALYHTELNQSDSEKQSVDQRFVKCKRPIVMVGGELTLETLDLVRTSEATYYEGPFQLKAANGVLFIDDFGRQKCDPQDLLNRWIVPLESKFDFLSFHGGQKLRVPFDCLLVFSTNLDPKDLVDEAFLRRIRYKILVDYPSEENFRKIWQIMCKVRKVDYDEDILNYLIDTHYKKADRPFRACQPRDLIDQYLDIAKYEGVSPKFTPEIIDQLCELYFVEL